MSATVGVSPVLRLGQLEDQRARMSVSERLAAVNTSGQRHPVQRVVMVSNGDVTTVYVAMNTSGQRQPGRSVETASTDVLTDLNVSKRRDDGGHLRSADGDVTTCTTRWSVLTRPSHTTSIIRLKCTGQSAVHRMKFIAASRLTKQHVRQAVAASRKLG